MRISDSLVVQYVDTLPDEVDRIVFVDDATGREVVRPATVEDIRALMTEIAEASQARKPWEIDGIVVTEDELATVAYALGYFTGVVRT